LSNPIITLTTDYGTNDHLVGTLKGVILKINPDVTIVDITHEVAPYDVLDGALAIGVSLLPCPNDSRGNCGSGGRHGAPAIAGERGNAVLRCAG